MSSANDFITATQQTLGTIVKKPPLSERLLLKPPFRFLHDVISVVIANTGFGAGLYTAQEMKSDDMTKESKIAYLQKCIDLVQMALSEPVLAKPAKIIAGQEPELTNQFLQTLYKAVKEVPDSSAYVQKVLAGEKPKFSEKPSGSDGSAGSNKENRNSASGDKEKTSRSTSKKRSESKSHSKERSKDPEDTAKKDKATKGSKEKQLDAAPKKVKTVKPEEVAKPASKEEKKTSDKHDKPKRSKSKDKPDTKEQVVPTSSDPNKAGEPKKKRPSKATSNKETANDVVPPSTKQVTPVVNGYNDEPAIVRKPAEPAKPESSPPIPPTQQEANVPPRAANVVRPGTAAGRPGTAVGMRPSTARAAPPRVRRQDLPQEALQQQAAVIENANASTTIIAETTGTNLDKDDDAENFIVEDRTTFALNVDGNEDSSDLKDNSDPGALVAKILAAKKEQEAQLKLDSEETKPFAIYDTKEKERTKAETTSLQQHIQLLTRASHPLGKLMDFLQEDVDTIVQELEQWRLEYRQNEAKLTQNKSPANSTYEQLQARLEELNQQVGDQLDSISSVKSRILENEEKIQRAINAVANKQKEIT